MNDGGNGGVDGGEKEGPFKVPIEIIDISEPLPQLPPTPPSVAEEKKIIKPYSKGEPEVFVDVSD